MITEQYVSFDTAKMLKETGFDVPCNGIYFVTRQGKYDLCIYDRKFDLMDLSYDERDGFQCEYFAPTQALVAKWLREVHNIHVFANYFLEGCDWFYVIVDLKESDEVKGIRFCIESYESYEEALETGLQQALKLIKKEGSRVITASK